MKTLLIICLSCMVTSVQSQDNKLQTEATSLDQLIIFIANNFPNKAEKTSQTHHITFLIESPQKQLTSSEKTILKQSFTMLSHRLLDHTLISIGFYNSINGLLLNQTKATQLKEILHAIDSGKLQTMYSEGISETLNNANAVLENYSKNTIVFVNNPVRNSAQIVSQNNLTQTNIVEHSKPKNNSKNNMVLLTAITLLPELINIIKD